MDKKINDGQMQRQTTNYIVDQEARRLFHKLADFLDLDPAPITMKIAILSIMLNSLENDLDNALIKTVRD